MSIETGPVLTKICGLRTSEAAIAASEHGADYLGFILAPSKRQIGVDAVLAIRHDLAAWHRQHGSGSMPRLTAVVVNASPQELQDVASSDAFDVIQLSGDEEPGAVAGIDLPVIKALRIGPDQTEFDARRVIESWLEPSGPASRILLDAWHPGAYGGTGRVADWTMAAKLAADYPIMLAGGLTPENVAEAIATVRPLGVDVSSGVETDGVKDHALIRAFLAQSRVGGSV